VPRFGPGLFYRDSGEGRPLVLLHGVFGDGSLWRPEDFPGHRVIRPDFRGHGDSAQPHDPAAYPPDVLTDDGLALIDHLGLDDYDLGGYSLGGRIVVRMLVRGATPRRAVVGGQGLREVLGTGGGTGAAIRAMVESGRPVPFLDGKDTVALMLALDSIVATPAEPLSTITTPTLVVLGADDERAASGDELAALLPHATRATVPGTHGTAATSPELVAAMREFLRA
jgi:pimeloyl-ACP methyl ester carboxylesterase